MTGPSEPQAGRSPLLFIFLTVFIDLLGFGIVIPLLPIYSKAYHASETELGLLFACFSGMQFVFAPMWGRLSDRIGRRPVLIGGLIGTAGSYVLFANAHSMALLYASRLLAGFFGANISSAQAYIADVTTPANRAKGMGLIGAAFGLGFTFGPALGGSLSKVSLELPGYVAAGFSLCAAGFGFLKLHEPARHSPEGSRLFSTDQLRDALSNSRIGILILLNFMAIFSFSAFESMFTRFGLALFPAAFKLTHAVDDASMDEIIAAAPIAGYYMFGIGIISALIQGGFIRRLIPKYGETRLVIAGPLILGVALAIVGAATSWWWVIAGCLVLPCGFGLSNPSIAGLLSRAVPGDRQGAYLGMSQSAASLARVLGPVSAGILFHRIDPRAPFWAGAGVLLCATALAMHYRARHGASFANKGD
jgi:DHA1 family tetracycline resistance protein-like MFS transporter